MGNHASRKNLCNYKFTFMKLSIYSVVVFAAAFTLCLPTTLTAGAPTTDTEVATCPSCAPAPCTCPLGCGCSADGHDYFPHAPIGVMGDHIHREGGLMASYRYMFMRMGQNYDASSKISDTEARAGYMMAPTDMDMQMHMLGLMYAPTDKLTLGLMTNYQENSMSMVNAMNVKSSMKSSGWGDTQLSGYYSVYREPTNSAHIGLGLSAPTGSIDEKSAPTFTKPTRCSSDLARGTSNHPSLGWDKTMIGPTAAKL
jgi:hypothetical protein